MIAAWPAPIGRFLEAVTWPGQIGVDLRVVDDAALVCALEPAGLDPRIRWVAIGLPV
jgi:hypothetical protein